MRRSSTMLDASINEGYRMLALATQGCELTYSFTYNASAHFAYIRSNLIAPLAVTWNGTRLFPTRVADWDDLSSTWVSDAAGTPQYYAFTNTFTEWPELWLYERPSTTATVQLTYAAIPDLLTMDTDVPRLPAEHHYAVVWWAYTWELLKERGAIFVNKAFQTVQKFVEEANALRQYVYTRTPDRDWLMPPLEAEAVRQKLSAFLMQAPQAQQAQEMRDLTQ